MKKKRLLLALFVAILGTTSLKAQLPAGTYTIGTSGDENYSTIQGAILAMSNGIQGNGNVIFNISTGTYTNDFIELGEISGTSTTSKITFQAATDLYSDVTIRGTGIPISLNGTSYVNFRNLTIITDETTDAKAIKFEGACYSISFSDMLISGKTVLNSTLFSSAYSVIYQNFNDAGSSLANTTFTNCTVSGGTYGFYFFGDGQTSNNDIHISNCSVNDQVYCSIYMEKVATATIKNCTLESGADADYVFKSIGSSYVQLDGNLILAEKTGTKTCVSYEGDYFYFTNNLLHSTGDNSGEVKGVVFKGNTATIKNNTLRMDDGNSTSAAIEGLFAATGMTVENNIIMAGNTPVFKFYAPSVITSCNYNCFDTSNQSFATIVTGGGYDLTGWQGEGYGTNTINENIPFSGNFAFAIGASSPCINAGNPSTNISTFQYDINGSGRVFGGIIDIGAMELQAVAVTVDAGVDIASCGSTTLAAGSTNGYTGTWAVVSGDATITDLNSPTTTVTNLLPGTTELSWTIYDGLNDVTDHVIITNTQPIVSTVAVPNFAVSGTTATIPLVGNQPEAGQTGAWIGSDIADSNSYSTTATVTGLISGTYTYSYLWKITNNSTGCFASASINVDVTVLEADAGADITVCGSTATMSAAYPSQGIGSWSVISGGGDFSSVNMNTAVVTNIPPGANIYRWTVTANGVSTYDEITVTNNTPIISAGEDIHLTTTSVGNLVTTATLNATSPTGSGTWLVISGGASIEGSNTIPDATVISLAHGENVFQWEVTENSCTATDQVVVTSGYSVVSAPNDGSLDWEVAGDWDLGVVPSAGDSVTIFNCTASVSGGNVECTQLVIGSGTNFVIEGTARAAAVFRTPSLVVEQTAERFPGVRGTANVYVHGGATLIIDGEPIARSTRAVAKKGFRIGSGGSLVVEQTAERGSTRAIAKLRIGSGRSLVVEQTAERTGHSLASAKFRIGSGGSLVVEQTAERNAGNTNEEASIKISKGGEFLITNNNASFAPAIVTLPSKGAIEVGSSSSTVKAELRIRGGSLVVEQTAERSTRGGSKARLRVSSGGSLVVEQTAERGASSLHVPSVSISNGTVTIGTAGAVRNRLAAVGFYTRSVVVEQTAERSQQTAPNLVINGDAGLYIELGNVNSDFPNITLKRGATVTVEDGAEVDLNDSFFNTNADFILEKGASFINKNPNLIINAGQKIELISQHLNYVSSPFSDVNIDNFIDLGNTVKWSESAVNWDMVNYGDLMTPLKGFASIPQNVDNTTLYGVLNAGQKQIQLTNDGSTDLAVQGWNLVGNPYASALDLESMDLSGMNKTIYFYDAMKKNYSLYQIGGISTNGASQYVQPGQGFFVKTEGYFMLTSDIANQVHQRLATPVQTRSYAKILKLKATGNGYADEAVIHFKDAANENYNNVEDAFKKYAYDEVPQLYTLDTDGKALAINTLPFSLDNGKTVTLAFKAGQDGNYTITATELAFNNDVSVSLVDSHNSATINLRTTPSYSFNYTTADADNRFTVIFGSGINSVENANHLQAEIFSANNDVFVKLAKNQKAKIKIYNISGQLIDEQASTGITTKISTHLPTGVYIVKAISENGMATKKVVLH